MTHTAHRFLIIISVVFGWIAFEPAHAAQLETPVKATVRFTSSFCEYRPFRFHAGVDFSTGGITGVPVVAVEDGYIWRVRTAPYGYGKVVYLRLTDGRTAVYAHLERFADSIQSLVRAEQERRQTYTVDLFLQPDQARFKRGDVIAWSGRTGIGAPHLHFEIRDRSNRPVDPLANGLIFDDTVEPTIGVVAFVPMDADARIDGQTEPVHVPVVKYGKVWTSRKKVILSGRVGVALAAWDRTQRGQYRLSLRSTNMAVDGREVFSRFYDVMSFGTQHLSVFDRNFQLAATGKGRFFNMYLAPGNTLPFYGDRLPGAGILACEAEPVEPGEEVLGPGEHELSFTIFDFDGNAAEARLTAIVGRPPRITEFRPVETEDGLLLRVTAEDTTDSVELSAFLSSDNGRTWREIEADSADLVRRARIERELLLPSGGAEMIRVVASDTLGLTATRVARIGDLSKQPRFEVKQYWNRDWVAFDVTVSHPLPESPSLVTTWGSDQYVPMDAREVSPGLYEAEVRPDASWPKEFVVRVLAGEGTPTIVSQWRSESSIPGRFDPVTAQDTTEALYRGVVRFTDAIPDSGGVIRISAGEWDTTFAIQGRVIGTWGGDYYTPDGGAGIEVGRGVFPEPFFVRIDREELPEFPELEAVGTGYIFEPQVFPLIGEATTVVSLPDSVDLTGVALYAYSPRGADILAPATESFNHTFRARVQSLSTVGVYRDQTPPVIRFISPARRADSRTPRIRVLLTDKGSGFPQSDDAMEMRIDDRWVPAEYDPEQDVFTYTPERPLDRGEHSVVVHARDNVGNESSATYRFTIE